MTHAHRYEMHELPADFIANFVVIDLQSDEYEFFDIELESIDFLLSATYFYNINK